MTGKRIPKRATINIDEDTLESLKFAKGILSNNEYLKLLLPLSPNRALKIGNMLIRQAEGVIRGTNRTEASPNQVTDFFNAFISGLNVLVNKGDLDEILDIILEHFNT